MAVNDFDKVIVTGQDQGGKDYELTFNYVKPTASDNFVKEDIMALMALSTNGVLKIWRQTTRDITNAQ